MGKSMKKITSKNVARAKTPKAVLTLAALGTLLLGPMSPVGGNVQTADAAPYVNCDAPVYNRTYSASIRCDAASSALIRIRATCYNLIPFPVYAGNKYTAWESIAAGTSKTMYFAQDGWCTGWNQTWRVDPEIA